MERQGRTPSNKLSPYKKGFRNQGYVNPSYVSNEVFYDPHYEDPKKPATPVRNPLGIPPNGYGEYDGYRMDRYSAYNQSAEKKTGNSKGRERKYSRRDSRDSDLRKSLQNDVQAVRQHHRNSSRSRTESNASDYIGVAGGEYGAEQERASLSNQSDYIGYQGQNRSRRRSSQRRKDSIEATPLSAKDGYKIERGSAEKLRPPTPPPKSGMYSRPPKTPSDDGVHLHRLQHETEYYGPYNRSPARSRPKRDSAGRQSSRSKGDKYYDDVNSHDGHSHQQSQDTYTGKELICNNCVNKEMISEKDRRKQMQAEMDRINQAKMLEKIKLENEQEREKIQQKKQRFKDEAIEHWGQVLEEKQRKKANETPFEMTNVFINEERFKKEQERSQFLKKKLRDDLKQQIREKTREKIADKQRENEIDAMNVFQIGGEYVNKYQRQKEAHMQALQDQIDEKNRRKIDELEVDKLYQEKYGKEIARINDEDAKERLFLAQKKRKLFIEEIEKMKREKQAKKQAELNEKLHEFKQQEHAKLIEQERQASIQQQKTIQEERHLRALQEQLEIGKQQKAAENKLKKSFKIEPLIKEKKSAKKYNCNDCENTFPRNQLNLKRRQDRFEEFEDY